MDQVRQTRTRAKSVSMNMAESQNDDLSRNVYCILGVPVDDVDFATSLRRIEIAANSTAPFLISTPNLNFLVNFHLDPEFRESLCLSDLCPADGVAIIWVARLLGVPIKERVAGSDIIDLLKLARRSRLPLRIFLFGGEEGVAEAAGARLQSRGLMCVGTLYPGFGTVEQMSGEDIINTINASNAQILSVSLGATKGQSWLLHNHDSLRVPVRVHLGATINFQAGTVKRAPRWLRRWGFEWLWRIKEEPHLWTRYAHDVLVLFGMLLTRVAPLALAHLRQRFSLDQQKLAISEEGDDEAVTIRLRGVATAQKIDRARCLLPRCRG